MNLILTAHPIYSQNSVITESNTIVSKEFLFEKADP